TIGGGFNLDNSLIGLDLEQRFALGNGLAFFLQPRNDLPGFLRHFQRRHHYASCHNLFIIERNAKSLSIIPLLSKEECSRLSNKCRETAFYGSERGGYARAAKRSMFF